jgi:hypothetical protein
MRHKGPDPKKLVLPVALAAAALAVTGCTQPTDALDTTNPQFNDRTVTPPTVLRTPVRVPSAPPTQPLPGPTGGAPGEEPEVLTSFTTGPDGEPQQAENGQQGPDGG